jgi:hypothetical protein
MAPVRRLNAEPFPKPSTAGTSVVAPYTGTRIRRMPHRRSDITAFTYGERHDQDENHLLNCCYCLYRCGDSSVLVARGAVADQRCTRLGSDRCLPEWQRKYSLVS